MTVRPVIGLGLTVLLAALPSFAQKKAPPFLEPDPPSLCDSIAGNLVLNCGFEQDFTDWTQGGNLGFQEITSNATYVNSGVFAAEIGPIGSDGSLTQIIADSPGTVTLDFWLHNDGGTPSDFSVQWDGVTIFGPLLNAPPITYSEEGPIALTSTGSDTLTFLFRQDPSFWGLDDISVVQVVTEPASILLLLTVLGGCVGLSRSSGFRNMAGRMR